MCITILCVPLQYQNKQTMKTLEITAFKRTMKVNIEVSENGVFIQTILDSNKRSSFYSSVSEALDNCTIVPVLEYLKTI